MRKIIAIFTFTLFYNIANKLIMFWFTLNLFSFSYFHILFLPPLIDCCIFIRMSSIFFLFLFRTNTWLVMIFLLVISDRYLIIKRFLIFFPSSICIRMVPMILIRRSCYFLLATTHYNSSNYIVGHLNMTLITIYLQ